MAVNKFHRNLCFLICYLLLAFISIYWVIFVCLFCLDHDNNKNIEIGMKLQVLVETWNETPGFHGVYDMICTNIYL